MINRNQAPQNVDSQGLQFPRPRTGNSFKIRPTVSIAPAGLPFEDNPNLVRNYNEMFLTLPETFFSHSSDIGSQILERSRANNLYEGDEEDTARYAAAINDFLRASTLSTNKFLNSKFINDRLLEGAALENSGGSESGDIPNIAAVIARNNNGQYHSAFDHSNRHKSSSDDPSTLEEDIINGRADAEVRAFLKAMGGNVTNPNATSNAMFTVGRHAFRKNFTTPDQDQRPQITNPFVMHSLMNLCRKDDLKGNRNSCRTNFNSTLDDNGYVILNSNFGDTPLNDILGQNHNLNLILNDQGNVYRAPAGYLGFGGPENEAKIAKEHFNGKAPNGTGWDLFRTPSTAPLVTPAAQPAQVIPQRISSYAPNNPTPAVAQPQQIQTSGKRFADQLILPSALKKRKTEKKDDTEEK